MAARKAARRPPKRARKPRGWKVTDTGAHVIFVRASPELHAAVARNAQQRTIVTGRIVSGAQAAREMLEAAVAPPSKDLIALIERGSIAVLLNHDAARACRITHREGTAVRLEDSADIIKRLIVHITGAPL